MGLRSGGLRLFFAIELPSAVQTALGRLRPEADGGDYRWVEPASLHVTVAFLGEQRADRLPLVEQIGLAAAAESEAATLSIGQPGVFGSRRAPRVLWVGLDGDIAALTHLQDRLAAGLAAADFTPAEAPYRPHITVARRRSSSRGGGPSGWPPNHLPRPSFPMNHLTLFESRLSPRGATYVALRQLSLARS